MILTKLSFALLLRDDFSGEDILSGGHAFMVDGKRVAPVRKPEGYYIFTGISRLCTVSVFSAYYESAEFQVDPEAVDPQNPVLVRRLLRRGDIRFSDCDRIEGTHKPGETVFAFIPESPPLLLAAASGGSITLQGYTAKQLCRRRYAVGSGKNRELFVITGADEGGGYRVEPPLIRKHSAGEAVVRACMGRCDSGGHFVLPVEKGIKEKIEKLEYYDEGEKQWGYLSVTAPS